MGLLGAGYELFQTFTKAFQGLCFVVSFGGMQNEDRSTEGCLNFNSINFINPRLVSIATDLSRHKMPNASEGNA